MNPRSPNAATVLEHPTGIEPPPFDGGEDESVADFIRRHRHPEPLLHDVRREVDAQFGLDTPVLLELSTDPEEGDAALFARIRTHRSVDDALDRLDALSDAWWLDDLPRAKGLLRLDIGR